MKTGYIPGGMSNRSEPVVSPVLNETQFNDAFDDDVHSNYSTPQVESHEGLMGGDVSTRDRRGVSYSVEQQEVE